MRNDKRHFIYSVIVIVYKSIENNGLRQYKIIFIQCKMEKQKYIKFNTSGGRVDVITPEIV